MTKREVSPLKKHIEESPKIRALKLKRKKDRERLLVLLGILLLVLVGGAIYAARYPKLQIENVTVSGNRIVDTSDIVAAVDADLAGNYGYVIPHRNSFFYPKGKIVEDLSRQFPDLKTVEVYRSSLDTVLVTVTETRGVALWCGDDAPAATALPTTATATPVAIPVPVPATCYFTDTQGKIISSAPDYSGDVYLKFYGGSIDPTDTDPLGQSFIDGPSFQSLLGFEANVSKLGFRIQSLSIGTDGQDTFAVDLGGGRTAAIMFMHGDDYGTLVQNLTVALGTAELSAKMKSDGQNLQYFDLRFTNKVYYKFTDDNTTAPPTLTGPTASYESALGH